MTGAHVREATTSQVLVPLAMDYLLAHIGLFAVLPVLPVLLQHLVPGSGALFVGTVLLLFNFVVRGGSLFCGRLLNRLPVVPAISGSLILAAGGFALLTVATGYAGVAACLVVAGLGVSAHGLMSRAHVATALSESTARNSVFSATQVAANVSAAIGPIVATAFIGRHHYTTLILLIAGSYTAAAAVAVLLPPVRSVAARPVRRSLTFARLITARTDPVVRRIIVVTFTGSFMYGQLFSAIALTVAHVAKSSREQAGLFTTNAILVAVMQIPVAGLCRRGLRHGSEPLRYLVVGIAVFSASFLIFGLGGQSVVGLFSGIVVFSLAETFFTPMVNTAFSAIAGGRSAVERFNLRQIAVATGESLGSFAGAVLFALAMSHGLLSLYWGALSVVGLAVVASYLRRDTNPKHRAEVSRDCPSSLDRLQRRPARRVGPRVATHRSDGSRGARRVVG